MESLHKITVQIRGTKYPITTHEEPAYVAGLAHKLDEDLQELMRGPHSVSLNEALVLIAMNYIDAAEKSEKNTDSLRAQVAEYLEDASKARLEASEARRELAKLEKRLGAKA